MIARRSRAFRPLETRGRRTMGAILLTFALFSALGITLSIHATARSKHQATVVRVASRQRTLAERYVKEVLLVHHGMQADPALTAQLLADSARVLLDRGGRAVGKRRRRRDVPRAHGRRHGPGAACPGAAARRRSHGRRERISGAPLG